MNVKNLAIEQTALMNQVENLVELDELADVDEQIQRISEIVTLLEVFAPELIDKRFLQA